MAKVNKGLVLTAAVLFLVLLILPLTASAGGGGINWGNKKETNFTTGPDAWDSSAIYPGTIINDGGMYKLWYTGYEGYVGKIGFADSSYGSTWNKHVGAIMQPTPGAWDSYAVANPSIIKDGGTYKMWYRGSNSSTTAASSTGIGYATSPDGLTWTKYGSSTKVISPGVSGQWDDLEIMGASVIKISESDYRMWYGGRSSAYSNWRMGYATSSDGIAWTKYSSNPVLSNGNVGSWKQNLRGGTVTKEGDYFRAWYGGEQGSGGYPSSTIRIGVAVSKDGINWMEYAGNPVLWTGAPGAFDEAEASTPMVVKDSKQYMMWYRGKNSSSTQKLGLVTSSTYERNHVSIKNAVIASFQIPYNNDPAASNTPVKYILAGMWKEGPSAVDVSSMKVEGPGGYSHVFGINETGISPDGLQYLIYGEQKSSIATGDYTFTLTTDSGLTATKTLTYLSYAPIAVPRDGTAYLDRSVTNYAGAADKSANVYTGNTTPTFKWKPYLGDSYYYRIEIQDYASGNSTWYQSTRVLGSTKDLGGYLSVTVPAGKLKANTPYQWRVEVTDKDDNNTWSARNRSVGATWLIYTGTKDSSGNYVDDGGAYIRSHRSISGGNQTKFTAEVKNIAPWDMDGYSDGYNRGSSPNRFRVGQYNTASSTELTVLNMKINSPPNDTRTYATSNLPFWYHDAGRISGIPANGNYRTWVYANAAAGAAGRTIDMPFTDISSVPTVYEMSPYEHEALIGTTPTLQWKSRGAAYQYKIFVYDMAGLRFFYTSDYQPGLAEGEWMSVTIPSGALVEHNDYLWAVMVRGTAADGSDSITTSKPQLFTTGFNGGYGVNNSMVGYGSGKLAAVFTSYGSENGIWSYSNGWSKLADWVPKEMIAFGDYLAVSLNKYDTKNGIWKYDGANWGKLSDWIPETYMVGWGGSGAAAKLAANFTNYGTGNGLWSYDGTSSSWSKLTDWIPDRVLAWGGTNLAGTFNTNSYGSEGGIWSYNGTAWTKLTDWLSWNYAAWGADKLAASFKNYEGGNGIWSFNGTSWSKLTDWVPDDGGSMTAWGAGNVNLAATFSSYGDDGIWNHNGTSWAKISSWRADGHGNIGNNWLGAAFTQNGTGNGLWKYDGANWTKLSDWIPDDCSKVGINTACTFTEYDSSNGIWQYDGTNWTKLTDWIPANQW